MEEWLEEPERPWYQTHRPTMWKQVAALGFEAGCWTMADGDEIELKRLARVWEG